MKTDRHVSALRLFWKNCRVLFHNDALSWWRLAALLFGSIPMGHSWRTGYVACGLRRQSFDACPHRSCFAGTNQTSNFLISSLDNVLAKDTTSGDGPHIPGQ